MDALHFTFIPTYINVVVILLKKIKEIQIVCSREISSYFGLNGVLQSQRRYIDLCALDYRVFGNSVFIFSIGFTWCCWDLIWCCICTECWIEFRLVISVNQNCYQRDEGHFGPFWDFTIKIEFFGKSYNRFFYSSLGSFGSTRRSELIIW